jgi:hypothetical protein
VSLFYTARDPKNLWVAGECLSAYRRGEASREAQVGALLEAEQYALLRSFFTGDT